MRRSAGKALLAAAAALTITGVAIGTAQADTRTAAPSARAAAARSASPRASTTSAGTSTKAAVTPCPSSTASPLPARTVTATKIQGGFNFLEGPVWHAASGSLFFSDMQNATGAQRVQPSTIRRFTPPSTFTTFVANSGSNGLAITPDGTTILAATQDQRSVSSYRIADQVRGVVASSFGGGAFNSPNDLTVRSDGTVYFTDPNFQRGNRADAQGGKTSVFRVAPATAGKPGTVTLVDNGVHQPNGVAIAPDEKTLYVGGNADNAIFRYTVAPDGSTGPRTRFASITGPDGVTIDCAGNLYWASFNDGKVHVFNPAGTELGTIAAGTNTTNLAFGGSDRRTLFITSGKTGDFGLYSVRLALPGSPF